MAAVWYLYICVIHCRHSRLCAPIYRREQLNFCFLSRLASMPLKDCLLKNPCAKCWEKNQANLTLAPVSIKCPLWIVSFTFKNVLQKFSTFMLLVHCTWEGLCTYRKRMKPTLKKRQCQMGTDKTGDSNTNWENMNDKIVFEILEQKSQEHFKSVLMHCFTIYWNEFGEP